MVIAYVKIEKEKRASHLAEDELDLLAENGRSEQMQTFLRDFPELKPPVPPLPLPIMSASKLTSLDPSLFPYVPTTVPVSANAPANVTWSCYPRISPNKS